LLVEENKSEEKDIKLIVFYRKTGFFSSFCGNSINFVRVLLYNKVQLIRRRMENRIKVVLADKKRTNKWLSEQLECAPTTVSKWCTNSSQPPMETFVKIAELLEVDINELLRIEKQ
jgi:DNA-binding Xre family transcriptional regulator